MSDWKAHVQSDWTFAGLNIVWARDFPGGREVSNGHQGWHLTGDEGAVSLVEPLRLTDEQGRALLAELLRHYNGADDSRMLRKDYDAERARVDKLIDKLIDKP